jgi:hypothetical protein
MADNKCSMRKKKKISGEDYSSCGCSSSPDTDRTVELKTEDIAGNSKKTMNILNDYITHLTNYLNKNEYADTDLQNLEYTDLTNYNLQIYQDDGVYYSFVLKAQNQFLYIIPIHDSRGNLYMPKKEQIEISFVKDEKRYGFDASVVDFKDNVLKIKRETQYYITDVRQEERIKTNISALIFINSTKYNAIIVNISKSGALIQTDVSLSINQRIALEFVLNNTKMVMFAEVVRIQTIKQNFYFGLKFIGGSNDNI